MSLLVKSYSVIVDAATAITGKISNDIGKNWVEMFFFSKKLTPNDIKSWRYSGFLNKLDDLKLYCSSYSLKVAQRQDKAVEAISTVGMLEYIKTKCAKLPFLEQSS